jgi:uncharacterized protein (DUF58 family)
MTVFARWLALPSIAGLFLGILRGQTGLALLSLSILLWLLVEWLIFTWRVWIELPQLQFTRRVNGRDEPTGLLWAGRLVTVSVEVKSSRGTIGPALMIRDVVPENMDVADTGNEVNVKARFDAFEFSYTARVRGAGRLRLPGFRIVLQDAQGFFRLERFIPAGSGFSSAPGLCRCG